jgi:hypothetical protein
VTSNRSSSRRSRALAVLLGALAGLALAVDEVGNTLKFLQTIPQSFRYQGLPRPTNLDWIAGWAEPARSLAAASGLLGLIAPAALLGLALLVFRTLNPDFHLIPPVPPEAESGAVLRQPIHRWRLRQIASAVVVSAWLLGYIGAWLPKQRGLVGLLLTGPTGLARLWPGAAAPASAAGLVLLIGGLWLVWGEGGFLRPAAGEAPRVGTARALAAAALAGIALTPFALPFASWAQEITTEVLQGIGGSDQHTWLTYLRGVLIVYPLALAAAAWTAMSLARWSHFPTERRALAAGGAVAVLAGLGVVGLLRLAGEDRFDHGIPLSQAAGVPRGPAGTHATLTLLPGPRPVAGLTPLVSGQGLTATDASARRMWAYLRGHRFQTVHLFPALMHVCQCEALAWNSDRFLATTLQGVEHNPHPGFCQLLVEKLAHTAATPTARLALARLHDPRRFHLPRGGELGMIALYRRLLPDGGEVRGRLFADGAPARAMRVGLLDEALWEQLRGSPSALAHRLVVASSSVDDQGVFRLRDIPAGRYLLVVAAPALGRAWSPADTTVRGSPGPIRVPFGGGMVDVGSIRLFLAPPKGAGSTRSQAVRRG